MAENLPAYTGQSCDWYDLPCHLTSFGNWLADFLLYIPRKIFEFFTDAIAALVGGLDLPVDTSLIAGIPSGVAWFADITAAPEGFGFIMAALLARFALKLIPTLGF